MALLDETVEASDSASGAKKTRELAVGNSLGKYRLERELGSGGMGVVWAAQDPDLERAVALKVLRHENASRELRTRLLREARAMARLKHPNVLTVYEVDSEGDRDFIAMELVDGASLDAWVKTAPPRDAIWDAILSAGEGLAAAHRAGLVHRDFKPHNVLRSDDGRVLVTDFGLARGHGDDALAGELGVLPATGALDETLEAAPLTASTPASRAVATATRSSSMDVPLTQTGALIGTPAYMAPEQFTGASPDPRTDQFAYCVTAWQLLAGARPYAGATIEELKRAAEGGASAVKADLPGAVRAVLARGLEPDPEKRWPDMKALLAALSRARARPRRIAIAFAGVIGVAGVAVAMKLASGSPTETREPAAAAAAAAPSMCETSPEAEIAKAWSPAVREEGMRRFGKGFERPAAELDGFAQRWITSYRSACTSARTTRTFAKLGCLLGERDEVADLADLMRRVPVGRIDEVEMGGVLPRTQACDGDTPVAPPTLPDDPRKQARIKELRHAFVEARFAEPKQMLAGMPKLLAEAEAIAWQPILAEAHHAFAIAADRSKKQWELARDHYKKANQLARATHHAHLEAETWVGLLASEIDAASDPSDDKSFLELVQQARHATRNAGDDPVYHARITKIEAVYAACHGRLDDAIAKYDEARRMELEARDLPMAMRFTSEAVELMLRRNRPGDVDAAWKLVTETEQIALAAKLPASKFDMLWETGSMLATLRGDHATARAWIDRTRPPKVLDSADAITGRVVDGDGKPVAGATVVAWKGALRGHAHRLFLSREFMGDLATTDATGAFTVRAVRDGAFGIVAELGDRRSQPIAIGVDEPVLTLAPTRTVKGTVTSDGSLTGVIAHASYKVGTDRELMLYIGARITAERTFELRGLPPGDARMGLDDTTDPNRPMRKLDHGPVRDGATLRWPVGPAIDAIVHGATDNEAMVFVVRGRHAPPTMDELFALVMREPVALAHEALIVGIGDSTVEGMKRYQRGDRHAIFLNNAPGEVTACVTYRKPKAPVQCQTVTLPNVPAEKRDGRDVYPAIPIEFRL